MFRCLGIKSIGCAIYMDRSAIEGGIAMSGIDTVPKPAEASASASAPADPAVITGRTPYDAAVDIVRMFGRAAPYFVLLAALAFASLKWFEADQSKIADVQKAQSEADAKYAKQIEELNERLQKNSESLENVRSLQLDGLKKLIELSDQITATVARSQGELTKQQGDLLTAQNAAKLAQQAKEEAERQNRQLAAQRDELQREAAKAENTIDAATRLAGYLVQQDRPGADRTELSRRFENNDPTRISRDEAGDMFYGAFRIPGNEMANFIAYLVKHRPRFANQLNEAGGAAAADEGDDEFKAEWRSLAQDGAFNSLQKSWIETDAYQPFIDRISSWLKEDGVSFAADDRSVALQAVLWSVVLQHGRQTAVVRRAWTGVGDVATADDRILICRIYAERRNFDRYFKNASEATIALLNARFALEEKEALRMLDPTANAGCGP